MFFYTFVAIVVGIGVYLYGSRKKVVQRIEKEQRKDQNDLIKGFRFHATPKITTRK